MRCLSPQDYGSGGLLGELMAFLCVIREEIEISM